MTRLGNNLFEKSLLLNSPFLVYNYLVLRRC